MHISTILPMLALLLVAITYLLHMEIVYLTVAPPTLRNEVHVRYTQKYGTTVLLLFYLSAGGIWEGILGTVLSGCVQADPDSVFASQDLRVMK